MYRKIIIGHDLEDGGRDALALGRELAQATGAELVIAKVFPLELVPHDAGGEWRKREAEALAELVRAAELEGATADVIPSSGRGRGLYELAEEIDADMVVIGSSARGRLEQVVVGNVGVTLLHGSSCPIAVAPRGYRERGGRIRTITVGYDGSHEAHLALCGAFAIAETANAAVSIVGVAKPPPIQYGGGLGIGLGWDELKTAVERQMRDTVEAGRLAAPEGVAVDVSVVDGDPANALACAADADGGLLVLGSRGYGPVKRVLLGSVSAAVVRSACAPVLVFPRATGGEPVHDRPAAMRAAG